MPSLEELRSLESITAANLEDGDYTPMFEASSNRVRPITEAERRKTVTVGAESAPVNETKSTLTVNPAGTNNSIDYTAVGYGEDGDAVSVEYTAPVQAELEVSVADSAITVACGTKYRMTVAGTLSPDATGTLVHGGSIADSPAWSSDGSLEAPETGDWALLARPADAWVLFFKTDGTTVGSWTSTETDEDFPDGLTFVADDAETGTPTATAALPTAQQVIDAVEASTAASALVTVAANGTVTGAVAAVAAANLSGGVDATVSSAPFIITDDNLYVNTGTLALPVWKEAALSALS